MNQSFEGCWRRSSNTIKPVPRDSSKYKTTDSKSLRLCYCEFCPKANKITNEENTGVSAMSCRLLYVEFLLLVLCFSFYTEEAEKVDETFSISNMIIFTESIVLGFIQVGDFHIFFFFLHAN